MRASKPLSGEKVIQIPCKEFEFEITGRKGSHVRLSKNCDDGKTGTVVPLHDELAPGTLRGLLKLAQISIEDFERNI